MRHGKPRAGREEDWATPRPQDRDRFTTRDDANPGRMRLIVQGAV